MGKKSFREKQFPRMQSHEGWDTNLQTLGSNLS